MEVEASYRISKFNTTFVLFFFFKMALHSKIKIEIIVSDSKYDTLLCQVNQLM